MSKNKEVKQEENKEENKQENKNSEISAAFVENNTVKKMAWSEKRCLKYAKKYDSLTEWKNGHQSSYKAAESHNWISACSAHMSDTSIPLTKKQRKLQSAS